MLRCLLPLLPLLQLARAQCALVSVSECQPDPAEVIMTIPLPSSQDRACNQPSQSLKLYNHITSVGVVPIKPKIC